MQLLTYDECLTILCDSFDSLIKPRKIARANTNIIYLIFKAGAKGFELVNNIAYVLNNKFDPANCEAKDLESIASIVGTERKLGSVTGLLITATNNGFNNKTLLSGKYIYALDADTNFVFDVVEDTVIAVEGSKQFVALTENKGSFPVTAQENITVSSDNEIPSDVTFSCADNSELLGYTDETDLEFRQRLVTDTSRQNVIRELQLKLRNLPYVFDCNVVFNTENQNMNYDDYIIPPYYMLIFISGLVKNEIAEIIAKSAIYPTVHVEDSTELKFNDPVFATGSYSVFINEFKKTDYRVEISYQADLDYVTPSTVETKMRTNLQTILNTNVHKDVITSQDIYYALESLNLKGVRILGVKMFEGDSSNAVLYIKFMQSRIANLSAVTFNEVVQ